MAAVVVALVGLLTAAVRRAPKAADLSADVAAAAEVEVPFRPGTGTLIESGRVPASREVADADNRDARHAGPL
jgi:hypothetical protein